MLTEFEDSGHIAHLEQPEEFAAAVARFARWRLGHLLSSTVLPPATEAAICWTAALIPGGR